MQSLHRTVWKDEKTEANDSLELDLDSSLKRLQKLERNLRRLGIGGAPAEQTRARKSSNSLDRIGSTKRAPKSRKQKTREREKLRGKSVDIDFANGEIPPRKKKRRGHFGGKAGATSLVSGRVRKSRSKSNADIVVHDERSFRRSRSRDLESECSDDSYQSNGSSPALPPLPERLSNKHRVKNRSRKYDRSHTGPQRTKNRLSISSAHSHTPGFRSRSMPYLMKEARRSPSPNAGSTASLGLSKRSPSSKY